MPKQRGLRRFVRGIAPNVVWDLLKWIGGSSVLTALFRVAEAEYRKSPVDWWLIGILCVVGAALIVWGAWKESREVAAPVRNSPGDDLAEVLKRNNPNSDEEVRRRNAQWAAERQQQCEQEKQTLAEKLKDAESKVAELGKEQDRWAKEKWENAKLLLERRDKIAELAENLQHATERVAELEGFLAPLSPLRLEALRFRQRLQRFIADTGPEPVRDAPERGNDLEKNIAALTMAGLYFETKMRSFTNLLDSTYQVQLRADAVTLYWKFVQGGMPPDEHFGSLLKTPRTVEQLKELELVLWTKIGMVE